MSYGEAKVYFDGSHYIAIPHTRKPPKKRPKPVEERITVTESNGDDRPVRPASVKGGYPPETAQTGHSGQAAPLKERMVTRKELFDELYDRYIELPKRERKAEIMNAMELFFNTVESLKYYVDAGFERKQKNLISRRIRMTRKANLAGFDYFCTFTYDDKKHTEDTFKKRLLGESIAYLMKYIEKTGEKIVYSKGLY